MARETGALDRSYPRQGVRIEADVPRSGGHFFRLSPRAKRLEPLDLAEQLQCRSAATNRHGAVIRPPPFVTFRSVCCPFAIAGAGRIPTR